MSTELLELAADVLGGLRERVVFLGGATVGLWLSDPAARQPRVTVDVDIVAEVTTLLDYTMFQEDLRRLGLTEDTESGVLCRWRHAASGLVLDAVPLELRLAGFSGKWLKPAAEAAVDHELPSGSAIRVVPPAWLLATKLEAFGDRGANDLLSSRDFEDIVLLIDGREELLDEVPSLPAEAAGYVQAELRRLQALRAFEYGVEGALSQTDGQARAQAVTIPRFGLLSTDHE